MDNDDISSRFILDQEKINEMTILNSDEFMTVVFDDQKEAAHDLLVAVMDNDDLEVVDVRSQVQKGKLQRKASRFDVLVLDQYDNLYNFEFQKVNQKDFEKRALEYMAQLLVGQLPKGFKAKDIKKTFIVFLTDFDPFGLGAPMYESRFHTRALERYGFPVEGEEEIEFKSSPVLLFVNTKIQDESTPLGRLNLDLHESNPDKIHNKNLMKVIKFLKEDEGGINKVRDIMQEIIDEMERENKKRELDIIKNLYRNGVFKNSNDEIVLSSFGLTPEELEKIKSSL